MSILLCYKVKAPNSNLLEKEWNFCKVHFKKRYFLLMKKKPVSPLRIIKGSILQLSTWFGVKNSDAALLVQAVNTLPVPPVVPLRQVSQSLPAMGEWERNAITQHWMIRFYSGLTFLCLKTAALPVSTTPLAFNGTRPGDHYFIT